MNFSFLIEVAAMFLIPLAAVIIPVLIGQRAGVYHNKKFAFTHDVSIESVVSAAFGLLAFMLAFTFQLTANRYETRKELLMEEVKYIRTAYLRAGLIPEPFHTDTKKQLTEYVDLRVDLSNDYSKLDHTMSRSQEIVDSLWKHTEKLAVQDRSSEVYALYTTAINDIVDAYNDRITMSLVYRIPSAILWVLFILGVLSMFILGYQFGLSAKGSLGINIFLAIIFAVVMFLISALDRPETGLVPVNQRPLLVLQKELQTKQLNIINLKK